MYLPFFRRFLVFGLLGATVLAQTSGSSQDSGSLPERELSIRRTAEAESTPVSIPRGYALVVGVAKYEKLDPELNLHFTETDAEAVYRALIAPEGGSFPAENVHKLIGAQATLASLRREIEDWLPAVSMPSDRVVVYFAGHGFPNEKTGAGYFAPWDIDPKHLEETGYPMAQLGNVMENKVKARWKVLLMDACHSAKVMRGMVQTFNADLGKKSFLTLTAAHENDQSFEDPNLGNGFGLFSYFLVRGLQGEADRKPCDGFITAEELVDYVRWSVKKYALEHKVMQTPADYGDYPPDMVLGASKACSDSTASPPVASGTLVIEANMDDVLIYLDETLVGTVFRSKPLPLPGLSPGVHVIKGVRNGYQPDTKQEIVIPGQERTVSIRIRYPIEYKPKSRSAMERGEKLLFSHKSALDPFRIYDPRSQTAAGLSEARDSFVDALKEDDKNDRAAYDLAMTYIQLSDASQAMNYFRMAVARNPAFVDARVEYAGCSIESGDTDEGIRQLTEALQFEPNNVQALSHLARAYFDKDAWKESVGAADKALSVHSNNDQAYLWRAVSLRQLAAAEPRGSPHKAELYSGAREDFRAYLRMTNFSSPIYSQFAFYAIGFGLGRRGHPDRKNSYSEQRSTAYLGLCDCDLQLGKPMQALEHCRAALKYDNKDPVAYWEMGYVYIVLYNQTMSGEDLKTARQNFVRMIQINPNLDKVPLAKAYIEEIDMRLAKISR